MALFGIEQEIPLLRDGGTAFADFSNTTLEEMQSIIAELPEYATDYPTLQIGDLGIKRKRWHAEVYNRFNEDGTFRTAIPKGLEIRTLPHDTIDGALDELRESYRLLRPKLITHGFFPVSISFNPIHSAFIPDPPLNDFEKNMRGQSPESETANLAELTFGPDLNISFEGMDDDGIIDAGKKLTYYSPFIVPFSFSSPFKDGKLWEGLSARTFLRTGIRPAAMVFLHDNADMISSKPSLTQESRVSAERGRIEFKAFDSCYDLERYRALFVLLKGILMDNNLPGRAIVPDAILHQRSAQKGFTDVEIKSGAREILAAAKRALAHDSDVSALASLERMLAENKLPVYDMIADYKKIGSVIETLKKRENLII